MQEKKNDPSTKNGLLGKLEINHMSLECPFFDPHLTTHHTNLVWYPLKKSNGLTPAHLTLECHNSKVHIPHSNHLQIARVMRLWVDIHVDLMFIIILIVVY
jgi:hypothetical protein